MKKLFQFAFMLTLGAMFFMTGCKKSDPVVPVSDRINKAWTASTVKENATLVYTKGTTGNIRDYSKFKLDLSSKTSAVLTEYTGEAFTGTWTVSTDEKTLTLSGLSPAPTGTGGTIVFSINSTTTAAPYQLGLTRTTPSSKTGASTTDFALVNP
jgi:hypothetical protein